MITIALVVTLAHRSAELDVFVYDIENLASHSFATGLDLVLGCLVDLLLSTGLLLNFLDLRFDVHFEFLL